MTTKKKSPTLTREEPALDKPQVRLISKAEVLDRCGLTFPTIWQWMREGRFPLSREVAGGKALWLESEIDEWILSRPVRRYLPLKVEA
jgi:predicted DNA-binding transcriptional regulator AlpA